MRDLTVLNTHTKPGSADSPKGWALHHEGDTVVSAAFIGSNPDGHHRTITVEFDKTALRSALAVMFGAGGRQFGTAFVAQALMDITQVAMTLDSDEKNKKAAK